MGPGSLLLRSALLTAAAALFASPALAQRLPSGVVPDHYDIEVAPNLGAATFAGTERIHVTLERPSRAITLNAADIVFEEVSIAAGGSTQVARVSLDPAREQATFTVPRQIAAGPADVHVKFRGILNDQLRGLYLSKANNRRYAVSQLEATDARRMFPSFDEPAFKATFTLTAIIDKGDHAISNGAVVSDTPGPEPGRHTVKFETTPRMSSYLLALAVGDFECSSGSADGIPIRVCSTPDKRGRTKFAMEAAEQVMRYYNRYFAVKYPFKKLDVVAVPDFAAGAMENTAAIFYRETLLLSDPKASSVKVRKDIASVLAHEMAHQWFGDLVTMKWWDDIWLNEGFATWMASKPLAAWKPEWHVELDTVQENQKAMAIDSLKSTRPIRTKASTPDEINELFDAMAYEKGAAVLRMVEAWVGEEAFKTGINAYIDRFKYGNAAAEDFWGTLTTSTGKPVDRVMSGFVDQPGVPFVDTTLKCVGSRGVASVRQEDPIASGEAGTPRPGWSIPVCVRPPNGKATCEVTAASATEVPLDSCPAWVVSNAGGRGYYRVVNPPAMLRNLAADVKSLAPTERLALLADEWALVRAGRHDIDSFMDLASGFKGERNAAVVATLVSSLKAIAVDLTTPLSRPAYNAWVTSLLRPGLEAVGWQPAESENDDTRALRASLVSGLGTAADDPAVVAKSRSLVLEELSKPGTVEPTLLNAAVTVAARHGDRALYEKFLERSRAASDPEEHYRYMYALAAFDDPALVRRTMDYIASPEVRSQDTKVFLAALLANPDARKQSWSLLRERWAQLQKKTGSLVYGGNTVVIGALGSFCDSRTRADASRFFAVHKVPDAARTLQQSLERIGQCSQLAATQPAKLTAWLKQHAATVEGAGVSR